MNIGTGASIAAEIVTQSGDDGGGKLLLDPTSQNWTIVRYNAYYSASLGARCFNLMFSDVRNTVMFYGRGFAVI